MFSFLVFSLALVWKGRDVFKVLGVFKNGEF